jgi:hypothetical protein
MDWVEKQIYLWQKLYLVKFVVNMALFFSFVYIYIGRSILWCKMILDMLKTFLIQPVVALLGAIICWFTILFCAVMKDRQK